MNEQVAPITSLKTTRLDLAMRTGPRACTALLCTPWVAVDPGVATGELDSALPEAFRARGIVIRYPQREVRLSADKPV